MTPEFAKAVDPVFLYVLGVLERIVNNDAPDAEEVRERVQNRFREAEARVGEKPGWDLAKYALAGWIDDVLIDAPWHGQDWWKENSLEFAYFNTRDRAIEFFRKAREAAELTRRDALEVFYICVVLGFRGMFVLEEATFLAEQLNLPPTVDEWARRTARQIQLGQGRPTIGESARMVEGAPPLDGKYGFVGAAMTFLLLLAIVSIAAYFLLVPAIGNRASSVFPPSTEVIGL